MSKDLTRRAPDPAIVTRYCSPAEAEDVCAQADGWRDRFLTYWTLKEAYLKARGLGISVHLSDISFTLAGGEQPRISFLDSLAGTDEALALSPHPPRAAPSRGRGGRDAGWRESAFRGPALLMAETSSPAPRLLATSDIHISHRANRAALDEAGHHPHDWLILAGDVGEKADHLRWALDLFVPRFAEGGLDARKSRPVVPTWRSRSNARGRPGTTSSSASAAMWVSSRLRIHTRGSPMPPARTSCRCFCSSTTRFVLLM
jgi:hypothetical protein